MLIFSASAAFAAVSTEAFEGALDHDWLLFPQVERVIARPNA